MKGNSEKEKILKILRNSLLNKADIPYPNLNMELDVYNPIDDDPMMAFANNIAEFGGRFIYCKDEDDLIDKLNSLIKYRKWEDKIVSFGTKLNEFLSSKGLQTNKLEETNEVGISFCYSISAPNGAITITSNQCTLTQLPNILIIIAFTSQIAADIKSSLNQLVEETPQNITIINPSYLLKEEIKELYLFTVENLIQSN
jgi:hypothetical protein